MKNDFVFISAFFTLELTCILVCLLRQIDKQLDAVFGKGKPHIKKAAPTVTGEQIKGEQQGKKTAFAFI